MRGKRGVEDTFCLFNLKHKEDMELHFGNGGDRGGDPSPSSAKDFAEDEEWRNLVRI